MLIPPGPLRSGPARSHAASWQMQWSPDRAESFRFCQNYAREQRPVTTARTSFNLSNRGAGLQPAGTTTGHGPWRWRRYPSHRLPANPESHRFHASNHRRVGVELTRRTPVTVPASWRLTAGGDIKVFSVNY